MYFAGTAFAVTERYASSQRGAIYETIMEDILINENHDVCPRLSASHDCIGDGIKTELKGAMSLRGNAKPRCIFNHIGFDKDWQRIIFMCLTTDNKIHIAWHDRDTLILLGVLEHQQGGKSSTNDDYMVIDSEKIFDLSVACDVAVYQL